MKANKVYSRPITDMQERYTTLHLYYDLSEDAKNEVFRNYDSSSDAEWFMECEYQDIQGAAEWFMEHVNASITLESVHGPGTEQWFPGDADIINNWGCYREFSRIAENECTMCYDYDVMNAWNKYSSCLEYLYKRLENEDGTLPYSWYEEHYSDALENALNDVCSVLNKIEHDAEEYTYTREFFEEHAIDCSDSEHWFTADGTREFIRDSTVQEGDLECVESPFSYCEIIYENRSPFVLYVRESF